MRGGREEGEGGGGARLRVNERSDTKIRSDRAGIRPPDGGAGPVSRWIARCSSPPPPRRNCSALRRGIAPSYALPTRKRRMRGEGPWAIAKWDGPIRGMVAGRNVFDRRPSESVQLRVRFVLLLLLVLVKFAKFTKVSSPRRIGSLLYDTCILEMEEIWDFFFFLLLRCHRCLGEEFER